MIFDDTLDPPRLPSDGQFAQLLDYLNFAGVAPDALHLLRERFDDEEQREIYRDFLVKAPTTGAQKSLSCLFGSWDAAFVCGIPVSLLSFFDKCARGFLLRLGGLRIRPLELTRQKGLYDYEEWKANAAIHNALPRKWAFALAWFDEMQGSANEYFQKETEDPLHQALFAFDPSTVLPRPLPNDAAERLAQAKKNLTAQGLCHVLKWRGQFIEQINLGNNPLDLPGLADSLRFLKEPRLYPKENLELGIPSEVIDFQSLFDRAQWISAKEKLQSFLQKVASVGTETDRYTEIAKQEDGYDALKQAYRFFVRKIVGTLFVSLHDIDQYRPLPSTNTEDYHNLPQDAAPLYLAIADKSLNNRERHEVLSPPKLLKDRVLSNDPLGTVVSGDGITLAWELKLGECRIPMPFAPEPSTMQKIQEETISFVPSCRFFLSIQRDKKRTPQSHQLSLRARLLFGTSEDRDRTTRLTVEKFGTRQFLQPLGRLLSDRLTAWLQQLSPFLPLASFAQKPDMSSRQTFSFRADREDLRESIQQKKNFLLTSANLQGFLQQPMQKFFAGASAQLSSSLEDLRGARVNEGLQRQISRSLQKLEQ